MVETDYPGDPRAHFPTSWPAPTRSGVQGASVDTWWGAGADMSLHLRGGAGPNSLFGPLYENAPLDKAERELLRESLRESSQAKCIFCDGTGHTAATRSAKSGGRKRQSGGVASLHRALHRADPLQCKKESARICAKGCAIPSLIAALSWESSGHTAALLAALFQGFHEYSRCSSQQAVYWARDDKGNPLKEWKLYDNGPSAGIAAGQDREAKNALENRRTAYLASTGLICALEAPTVGGGRRTAWCWVFKASAG